MSESNGFGVVPNWLVRESAVTKYALLVYIAISGRADEHGSCFPSIALLAKEARCSERSVHRALAELRERGLVDWSPRLTSSGQQTSNLYRVSLYGGAPQGGWQPGRVGVAQGQGGGGTLADEEDTLKKTQISVSASKFIQRGSAEAFDRFWEVYPRREGKKKAGAAFDKIFRSGADLEQVIAGAQRYAGDSNRLAEFTKLPATWLNGACWEDPPLPQRRGHAGGPSNAQLAFERHQNRFRNGGGDQHDQRRDQPAIGAHFGNR